MIRLFSVNRVKKYKETCIFQVRSFTLPKNDILDCCTWKHGCLDGSSGKPSDGAEIHVAVIILKGNQVSTPTSLSCYN